MNQIVKPISVNLILAVAICAAVGHKNGVMGKIGNPYLPWKNVPEDMKYFSKVTKTLGGVVIMGYTTWRTLPEKYRILPGRTLIVLTRNPENENVLKEESGVGKTIVTTSVKNIHAICNANNVNTIWVAGGPEIYNMFLEGKVPGLKLGELHRTLILKSYASSEAGVSIPQDNLDNLVFMPKMVDPVLSMGVRLSNKSTIDIPAKEESPAARIEVFEFA